MNEHLFMGLDYIYWTLICLGVAVFYFILWPKPSASMVRTFWQRIIFRYFHALVWLFLALSCLFKAFFVHPVLILISDLLILFGLVTYLVFIFTFLQEKRSMTRK